MPLTIGAVLQDFALASVLLIAGLVVRAKIGLFQRLMIPASLTAGLLALALGRNGAKVLPLSENLTSYLPVLVVLVFAALPLGSTLSGRKRGRELGEMWSHVTFGAAAQYGGGMLFGTFVLGLFWTLHPGFGYILATGFFGGPGTTMAAAAAFEPYGWEDALSLGMACTTVGTVAAIVGGVVLVNWGARRGLCAEVDSPEKLTDRVLLTGLVPESARKPLGLETVSSSAIESLTLHGALVLVAAGAGWYGSRGLKSLWPSVEIPAFGLAVIAGFLLQGALVFSKTATYVDPKTVGRISGACADYLVVAGIASIELPRVVKYALPLGLLLLFGIALCLFQALVLGPKMFREHWFERSVFVYGLNTGTVPNAIMLLRIIDPQMKSRSLDTYAVVDVLNRPLSIGLLVLGPILIGKGYAVHFAVGCSILAFAPLLVARAAGWWIRGRGLEPVREKA